MRLAAIVALNLDAVQSDERYAIVDDVGTLDQLQRPVAGPGADATAGYNIAAYDVPLLEAEFRRVGVEFSLEGRRIVDAMRIFHTREPRNLEGAVRFYCGRDIEDAHSAEADTLSSFQVLVGQFKRYPDLPLDLDELDRISRPPEWFDRNGKLIWRDEELCLNFGKHKERVLSEVVTVDPGYLDWILGRDFSHEVKAAIQRARATVSAHRR